MLSEKSAFLLKRNAIACRKTILRLSKVFRLRAFCSYIETVFAGVACSERLVPFENRQVCTVRHIWRTHSRKKYKALKNKMLEYLVQLCQVWFMGKKFKMFESNPFYVRFLNK